VHQSHPLGVALMLAEVGLLYKKFDKLIINVIIKKANPL
jgi:hypothetical protein